MAAMPQTAPANFDMSTRRKIFKVGTLTKGTGANTQRLQIPKTGLLARLWIANRMTVAGTLTSPNAFGFASIIKQVRLQVNSGIQLYQTSMVGYSYLLQEMLESEYFVASGQNQGRTAVTATTANLDMVIPVCVNMRDPTGLIMLQNEQTIVTLEIDYEADATVATGATVTGTSTVYAEIFTVPTNPSAYPPLSQVHQILEDQQSVTANGDFTYNWPRGNVYLQLAHGLGVGASGADHFSAYNARLNQSDSIQKCDIDFLDMEHRLLRGRARPAGGIYLDFLGTSGLGNYGKARDLFNSALVTDVSSVITAASVSSDTLFNVRRQLVALQ